MLLILFLYLIIGQVAGQAQWCCHHRPNGVVYHSTTKHTPTYTGSKESTTSIEKDWFNKSYRFHHYILSDKTTSTNQVHPRNTITSTTSTEHSAPTLSRHLTCYTRTQYMSPLVWHVPLLWYMSTTCVYVFPESTADSSYSSTSPTLVQTTSTNRIRPRETITSTLATTTRTRAPCNYAPCTKTGPHECDPHFEDHCLGDRRYNGRTTSSALAQITSTEHLNQLDPRSTTSSIPRNYQCLNKLGNKPITTSRPATTSRPTTTSSGPFWWWVYMSLVNRSSKRSAASSTLAQVNSTDNSLFYPGNTPPPPDFFNHLDRITNMASNDRDDSGNTPNPQEAPSKSDCEPQPADILTPYTDTNKNPLDDLEANPDYTVPSSARSEDMIPEEPILPRSQTSDSTPKKAELGTKPAPDSTPTKMERVVSPASDATPIKPERFARSPPQQAKSSSSTPEKPLPKPEPPRCDRCGKTGFPGFCPYCSNMNNDGVGMF